jgi:hypothetical protein
MKSEIWNESEFMCVLVEIRLKVDEVMGGTKRSLIVLNI